MEEVDFWKGLDRTKLPSHIAIIMDGNGRWAKGRRLPRMAGHKAGMEAIREVVRACGELGIGVLTLYAFSSENWKRPKREVEFLMGLLRGYLRQEVKNLDDNGVRLRAMGRLEGLPEAVRSELDRAVKALEDNDGLLLNLALNYGGRAEIVDAVRRIVHEVTSGRQGVEEIDEKFFARYLYTAGLPDPDLLIRTSGENRISNFLLWQISYAEIWVTPVYWPDFGRKDLREVLLDYQKRERRFGGLGKKGRRGSGNAF